MRRFAILLVVIFALGGCSKDKGADKDKGKKEAPKKPEKDKPKKPEVAKDKPAEETPTFSLAWSEYPSWSTFGVAHEVKIINGKKGELGPIEKKWGVDIELKEADYDGCLVMYGAAKTDAVCITNMDGLNPSITRPSVAILPTSTSDGADALIVTKKIKNIKNLKGKNVYGLAKTVSEYCFVRNLELLGEKEKDYKFTNMDPGAAALAMQQGQKNYEAIVVWNPFVLETLNKRKDVRVLFDSTKIPGEIIDMVVISQDVLEKPGGENFARAVIDTFYEVNKRIADPKTHDDTLVALGEKFSHLKLDSMIKVVEQTKFYSTPEAGLKVLEGDATKEIMKKVVKFCVDHEIVPSEPTIGWGNKAAAPKAQMRFDPTYIKDVVAKK
jgi:NitT/TauT family transport system substrate-binding protein